MVGENAKFLSVGGELCRKSGHKVNSDILGETHVVPCGHACVISRRMPLGCLKRVSSL